ncbi:MAG: hydrogenase [Chloroflexi bacterium CG_4_9_14_3_um_filter_45_9]|nr:MAG: hydrogenase [Chloroflexi bacterium CG08_land_8_20_14_0_20_45_12]PIX27654.1 MAG: hydrogenase [Chloroflexi bacterium CG_4_8_14_3_um_filter_45_15]PJB49487.1 MAG: hydrogenase [Chloroflexi bacterium CG_4_9_14_3_um_filter_45_9]
MGLENPFVPYLATLKSVVELTPDIKLLKVELLDPAVRAGFDYKPGQFALLSAFGQGEAPFGIVSLPQHRDGLEFAVRRIGTVTAAIHELEPGDILGVRGPFGNHFPLEDYVGKNIVIIGGGIGMAPLRPVINQILEHRNDYGKLLIINGARTPQDLVFAPEFQAWMEAPRTKLELTVDRGDEQWRGRVALVPNVVKEVAPSPDNAIAITCGPPIMIRYTLAVLKELGFRDSQIITTLEAKMKCGLGKCARCNVGDKYICQDGPVFTFEQISQFLEQP